MYHPGVVNIQIRNVPATVRDALVANAKDEGQSLQAYLLDLLSEKALPDWEVNRRIFERAPAAGGTRWETPEEAQAFIDKMKAERDSRFDWMS